MKIIGNSEKKLINTFSLSYIVTHACILPPGARVEIEDKRGNTTLHTAARHGHASVTKTLVSNGANVLKRGAGGMLPVHMACLSGYSDCVENLIPRGELL